MKLLRRKLNVIPAIIGFGIFVAGSTSATIFQINKYGAERMTTLHNVIAIAAILTVAAALSVIFTSNKLVTVNGNNAHQQ